MPERAVRRPADLVDGALLKVLTGARRPASWLVALTEQRKPATPAATTKQAGVRASGFVCGHPTSSS